MISTNLCSRPAPRLLHRYASIPSTKYLKKVTQRKCSDQMTGRIEDEMSMNLDG